MTWLGLVSLARGLSGRFLGALWELSEHSLGIANHSKSCMGDLFRTGETSLRTNMGVGLGDRPRPHTYGYR